MRAFNCIRVKCYNQNVDIKLSGHDEPIKQPSSDTLKIKTLESQII